MADFRPFRALRYRTDVVGSMDGVLSPPFDVIDAEQEAALRARSPYNIIALELSEQRPDDNEQSNRYTRAAAALAQWRTSGAIAFDDEAAFYLYVQEFEHGGTRHRRTSLLGRLRLEPWDAHIVRPHEETMAKPKADRLQVMRHLKMNVSPVFALYRDEQRHVESAATGGTPLFDATTADGFRHHFAAITDANAIEAIAGALREEPFYILDGHHRYETALAYRDELRAAASSWTGDEPANFMLAAITSVDDPGLVLLPTHRLVRPSAMPTDVIERLGRYFDVVDTTPKSYDGTALLRLLARLSAAGNDTTAFGALGLDEGRLHLLTLSDTAAVHTLMPPGSKTWQALDVNVLEYAVLRAALGIEGGAGDVIDYTQDAARAHREVEAGRWPLAFLMNETKVSQMIAVADAKEKMPPKSTYFYPKLATGLVLNTLE
jgi:uncharacterized protein (DUF1015 family)